MRRQRKSRWIASGVLGLLGLVLGDTSLVQAATTIPRIGGGGSISISLYQLDGTGQYQNVTDSYLPRVGETVYVVVNGGGVPSLVTHTPTAPAITNPPPVNPPTAVQLNPYLAAQTTSAYLGVATNYPSAPQIVSPPAPSFADDFEPAANVLSIIGSSTGFGFKALDYGGMLVVTVGTDKFVIPKDINLNGIADSWEYQNGVALGTIVPPATPSGMVPGADTDAGPGSNAAIGDGISNFDEYRGFVVSGSHVRTDPRVKNIFVHLVNPGCGGTSYLGGGGTTYVAGSEIFADLNALITGANVLAIGFTANAANGNTTEWVDHFSQWEENQTVSPGISRPLFLSGTDNTLSDRRINLNAVYPILDAKTGLYIQKGLRITECTDSHLTNTATGGLTAYGSAGQGTPNGPDDAVIFTDRMRQKVIALVGGATPLYSTCASGGCSKSKPWTTPATTDTFNIIARMIQYYIAMEVGHAVKLTPTVEGTSQTSYGYHHAPGNGANMDQTFVYNSSTHVFSIPSVFGTTDQANVRLSGF